MKKNEVVQRAVLSQPTKRLVHYGNGRDVPTLGGCDDAENQGARTLFKGHLENLLDMNNLFALLVAVDRNSNIIFLVSRCPAPDIMDAIDTFIFGDTTRFAARTGCSGWGNVVSVRGLMPVLSTCPLHTNSWCGKGKHI